MPVAAPRSTAASVTLRAIGPAVSWSALIGITPARLHNPSVGLMPTSPFAPDGQTIEPSVSVPTAATARSAAAGTPQPGLEPEGGGAGTGGVGVEKVGHVLLAAEAPPAAGRGGRAEVGPFGKVGLGDDDRAGRLQTLRDERVSERAPGERPRARRRP